ncbi:MAG: hypothetical protein JXA41_07795 [Deltaproteobacteria bacterium]|nr:hypothetical protein [Deltaproteobacteria bacterium]
MKINRIDIYQCNTPFGTEYPNAHQVREFAESIVVNVLFDNGISGYGESAPRNYVTGENAKSVTSLIRDHFSGILLGCKIVSITDVKETLNVLEKKARDKNIMFYLSALGAIDTALLDALSKYEKKPLSNYLGPIVRNQISYTLPIPILPIETIKKKSRHLEGIKFSSVKVLMGESESENIGRVETVRSIFGADVDMSIEVNGKWSYQQAIDNLSKLKNFNIAAVEQPVNKEDFEGLKKVREKMGIPVIVDESLRTLSEAEKLIDSGACDILNIKISKCGGLLKSKEIADFALSRGIRFQLGTLVGETDILDRAGRSFALVSSNIIHFEGFSFLLFEQAWDGNTVNKEIRRRLSLGNINSEIDLSHQSLKMLHTSNL